MKIYKIETWEDESGRSVKSRHDGTLSGSTEFFGSGQVNLPNGLAVPFSFPIVATNAQEAFLGFEAAGKAAGEKRMAEINSEITKQQITQGLKTPPMKLIKGR